MNYKLHYDNLIRTRKLLNRKKYDGIYYEEHHIIMRSMSGADDKSNKILLTAKEHYIAHYLLWMIYRNNKTALAFLYMCNDGNKTNLKISSRVYNVIREECAKISSNTLKNMWKDPEMRKKLSISNSIKNKGRKHTIESRKNMSDAHKGYKQSQETIDKRVLKLKGQKRTQETKDKISSKNKGRKYSDNTLKNMSDAAKNRKLSEDTKIKMSIKISISKKKPRVKFKLISPDNSEYIFDGRKNVCDFLKNNNMSITYFKKYLDKGKMTPKTKVTENCRNWEFITLERIK